MSHIHKSLAVYLFVLFIFSAVVIGFVTVVSSKAVAWSQGSRLGAGSFDGAYCAGPANIKCPLGYFCVKESRQVTSDGVCVERVEAKR